MTWWREVASRVRRLGAGRVEREIDEEIRAHLDLEIRDNLEAGMAPDEARQAALVAFGNVGLATEDTRGVWRFAALDAVRQDLKYALRLLRRWPAFSTLAIVTLALGMGANTAIFSIVNAVLLRPLPFADSSRLVLIKESLPAIGWNRLSVSPAEFVDYRDGATTLEGVAAFTDASFNMVGVGDPERVDALRVSANLFTTLGVAPLLGRTFDPGEDTPGRDDVVVLSCETWRHEFAGDPAVLGRIVRLDERPYTVVGVMPEQFRFPYAHASFAEPTRLWVPLVFSAKELANRAGSFDYGAIGRLRSGATMALAQADVDAVASTFRAQYRDVYDQVEVVPSVVALDDDVTETAAPALLLLLGAVGLLLLVACANVANLLLARSVARRRELGVRSALGASRWRLVRQGVTESLLIAALGGLAGLGLAWALVRVVVEFGPSGVPRLDEARLDPWVFLFTAAVVFVGGIACGVAPALQAARTDVRSALTASGDRSGDAREGKRLRGALVVVETAAALVLLVGAGLLARSFGRLLDVEPGFDPHGVVVGRTAFPPVRYGDAARGKAVQREILDRIARLPGVRMAGVTADLPLTTERAIGFVVEEDPETVRTATNAWVSDDYFSALGIRMLAGRTFGDADREDTPGVVVINRAMARTTWPSGDAIGRRIKWGGWPGDAWLTVVGIVDDVKVSSLETETSPAIYMPIFQIPRTRPSVVYVVRGSGDAASLVAGIRAEIGAVDRELPIYDVKTMDEVVASSVAQRRFTTALVGAFAALALVLAAIGLYGVLTYSVAQRTREIGVRIALGARPREVVALVVRQGMCLAVAGIVIGLAAAVAFSRLLTSLLFGVSPLDPVTLVAVPALFASVALLACYVPARRATRVDPIRALRFE